VIRGDGRLNHDLLPGEKGPQDQCGVFGVWAPGEEVAKLNSLGAKTWQLGVIETASDVSGFVTSAKGVEGGAVRLTGAYA
jgi:hypothetical protein